MAVQVVDRENKKTVFPAEHWSVDAEGYLELYVRDGDVTRKVATFNKVAWQSVGVAPAELETDPKLRVRAAEQRLREAKSDLADARDALFSAQEKARKDLNSVSGSITRTAGPFSETINVNVTDPDEFKKQADRRLLTDEILRIPKD